MGGAGRAASWAGAVLAVALLACAAPAPAVLLDVQRPGCLVRQWMTANGASQGDLSPRSPSATPPPLQALSLR